MREVTIGELIKQTRKRQKLTQEEVCFGICETSTLSRIENNKATPTRGMLNALLQRLDISDDRFYAAINMEEFRINELCNEITACNVEFEKACGHEKQSIRTELEKKHQELRSIIEPEDVITEQFIIRSEINVGEYSLKEKQEKLLAAIQMTYPGFDLSQVKKGLFSFEEIRLINHIAVVFSENGDSKQALQIWEDLLTNINARFENIVPSRTQKCLILYGLSREYLITENFTKAKNYAEDGRELAVKHGIYRHLPGLLIILAECEYQIGNIERSKELFDDAYHLCKVINDEANKEIIVEAIKDYFS